MRARNAKGSEPSIDAKTLADARVAQDALKRPGAYTH